MHISIDIIVLASILVGVFALSFYFGKGALLSALLSLYTSTIMFSIFPFTAKLFDAVGGMSVKPFIAPLIFAVFWIFSFLIFKNVVVNDFNAGFLSKTLSSVFVTVIFTGTLLAVFYNILSFSQFYSFAEPVKTLFVFSNALFWWFLSGMVASFFLLRP
jgi:hypothetical protein